MAIPTTISTDFYHPDPAQRDADIKTFAAAAYRIGLKGQEGKQGFDQAIEAENEKLLPVLKEYDKQGHYTEAVLLKCTTEFAAAFFVQALQMYGFPTSENDPKVVRDFLRFRVLVGNVLEDFYAQYLPFVKDDAKAKGKRLNAKLAKSSILAAFSSHFLQEYGLPLLEESFQAVQEEMLGDLLSKLKEFGIA